ncbi:ABC transporter substrate-binding protein [Ferribacterium limneticum]|uniref:ABC transporter substrate-binding protein n=1 Tax=Ferribacterium limneticum TaxID=76259 RepID=UPI001CF98892|nr:ABC transporter substrate-binding protein [Ferribacterium limneticum]UCV17755.1 ABC transporter substrate-binding protein [Ferribacterium limneticum]
MINLIKYMNCSKGYCKPVLSTCFHGIVFVCVFLFSALSYAAGRQPIVIGQSLNLSPSNSHIGKRWVAGAEIYINAINASGGINGRLLRLVTLNDEGSPNLHYKNVQTLISDHKAVAIINCSGDAVCLASAKLAGETGVPLIGTISGSQKLYSLDKNRQVFPVRQTYAKEAISIAMQLSSMGISKVAVLTDVKDSERVEGLISSLPKFRVSSDVFHITLADSNSLGAISQKLGGGTYQAVILDLGLSSIDVLRDRGFFDRGSWPATNFSFANDSLVALSDIFKKRLLGFTMVVPNPEAHSLPLTFEFQRNAERYNELRAISFEGMESYINTRICVEAIRRAGSNVNPRNIGSILRGIESFNLGGYFVSFDNPNVPASSWLEVGLKTPNGVYIK